MIKSREGTLRLLGKKNVALNNNDVSWNAKSLVFTFPAHLAVNYLSILPCVEV